MEKNLGKKYDEAANAAIESSVEKALSVSELYDRAATLCSNANAAIAKKTGDYARIMRDLNDVVERHNDLSMRQVYAACRDTENPKLAAAKTRVFPAIRASVKNNPATKMPEKVEVLDYKGKIDLLKFCEFCGLDKTWWTTVEAYSQFLALTKSKNLGISEDRQKYLIEKFNISDDAKKVDMTKFSKSNLVTALQTVIDEMVFVPGNTEGMNALRVNNHDVEYVNDCITREGRGVCEVKFSDGKSFRRILFNVCYRLAVNGVYTLGYKEIRARAVPVAQVVEGSEKTTNPANTETANKVSTPETNHPEKKDDKPARVRKPRKKKEEVPAATPANSEVNSEQEENKAE